VNRKLLKLTRAIIYLKILYPYSQQVDTHYRNRKEGNEQ